MLRRAVRIFGAIQRANLKGCGQVIVLLHIGGDVGVIVIGTLDELLIERLKAVERMPHDDEIDRLTLEDSIIGAIR